MEEGEIHFVEPNDKGEFKREVFEITNDDVAELRETIMRVASEIIDLEFWDTPADPKNCDYADLRDALRGGE